MPSPVPEYRQLHPFLDVIIDGHLDQPGVTYFFQRIGDGLFALVFELEIQEPDVRGMRLGEGLERAGRNRGPRLTMCQLLADVWRFR